MLSTVYQDPPVFLYKAAFQRASPQPVLVRGVTPPLGQDFAFPFELRDFCLPVSLACRGPSGWQCTHLVCQLLPAFCVVCRLAERVLCSIIQIINEGIKQYWPHINCCVKVDFFLTESGLLMSAAFL